MDVASLPTPEAVIRAKLADLTAQLAVAQDRVDQTTTDLADLTDQRDAVQAKVDEFSAALDNLTIAAKSIPRKA